MLELMLQAAIGFAESEVYMNDDRCRAQRVESVEANSPPILAFANQKGGVGKTSVALGVASAAVRCASPACPDGHRVLVIDLDPQANASRALGMDMDDPSIVTATHLLGHRPTAGALAESVHVTDWPGVDVIPSELDLATAEWDGAIDVPFRLRAALSEGVDVVKRFDLIVIDCPPAVGRLLAAAMTAATHAVLVTDAASDGIRGISNVINTIQIVRADFNPSLEIAGVVVNRYRRSGEQDFREAELRETYGDLVTPGHIPERAALAEAHASGRSVHMQQGEGARVLADRFEELYATLISRIATPTTTGAAK